MLRHSNAQGTKKAAILLKLLVVHFIILIYINRYNGFVFEYSIGHNGFSAKVWFNKSK